MATIDRVQQDLKDAMRARDKQRVGALRMVLSELQKALKEGESDALAVRRRGRFAMVAAKIWR
jgi:uncharacterized protein